MNLFVFIVIVILFIALIMFLLPYITWLADLYIDYWMEKEDELTEWYNKRNEDKK